MEFRAHAHIFFSFRHIPILDKHGVSVGHGAGLLCRFEIKHVDVSHCHGLLDIYTLIARGVRRDLVSKNHPHSRVLERSVSKTA